MSIRSVIGPLAAALLLGAALPLPAQPTESASPRADRILIGGLVQHPLTLSAEDLKRAPSITESISLHTGHGTLSGSFTGVLLWQLLQQAGIKTQSAKNDILHHTIVVTGSDGYSTVLSAAEIDPQFGGERAIIAYERDGKALQDPRGFARLIFPADQSAGRAISGVQRIEVH